MSGLVRPLGDFHRRHPSFPAVWFNMWTLAAGVLFHISDLVSYTVLSVLSHLAGYKWYYSAARLLMTQFSFVVVVYGKYCLLFIQVEAVRYSSDKTAELKRAAYTNFLGLVIRHARSRALFSDNWTQYFIWGM